MKTFNSYKKNIRLSISQENEGTDTIIQNIYNFDVYADKNSEEYQINLKNIC